MLETVREFGQLKLADSGDEADALAEMDGWAVRFALRALDEIRGPGQVEVFRELDLEQDNLVEVLRRAIASRRAEVVFPVFAALAYRWTVRSAHSEILAFGEAVLDSTSGSRPGPELAPAAMLGLSLITATHLATGTMTGARGAARMKRLAREGHPLPPWLPPPAGSCSRCPTRAKR